MIQCKAVRSPVAGGGGSIIGSVRSLIPSTNPYQKADWSSTQARTRQVHSTHPRAGLWARIGSTIRLERYLSRGDAIVILDDDEGTAMKLPFDGDDIKRVLAGEGIFWMLESDIVAFSSPIT